MKQVLTIQGKTIEVELFPSQKKGKIGGKAFVYDKIPHGILLDGKHVPCDTLRNEAGEVVAVILHGKLVHVEMGRTSQLGKTQGIKPEVRAPLNGQVVRAQASSGACVKKGDVLLTLEAMKMENEIVAPISGTIRELTVKQKDVVKAGQLLFRIEPDEIKG